MKSSPEWEAYRKKHNLDKNVRIFSIKETHDDYYGFSEKTGRLENFTQAMLDRGWHQNMDSNSRIFDLKFAKWSKTVYSAKTKKFYPIHDFQKINNFMGVHHFTTKNGLTMSLRVLSDEYRE